MSIIFAQNVYHRFSFSNFQYYKQIINMLMLHIFPAVSRQIFVTIQMKCVAVDLEFRFYK